MGRRCRPLVFGLQTCDSRARWICYVVYKGLAFGLHLCESHASWVVTAAAE